jgi:hypothetical protein
MNIKGYREGVLKELANLGIDVDKVILNKAIEKAKRHMRNKYGYFDYECEVEEAGFDNGVCFYHETVANPDGLNTFNREVARNF